MKRLKLAVFVLLLCVCTVLSGVLIFKVRIIPNSAIIQTQPTIIVDAGHGGFDGGAVANDGTVEKDINLNISTCLASMLRSLGYDVIMTRSTDTGTEDDQTAPITKRKVSDLQNRLELINKYENSIFVSVHLNKFTTSAASGAQVFYSKNHSESDELGFSIQESITKLIQPENSRVIKQSTKNTYLLRNAKNPAVIVECGFLSNTAELKKLKEEKYQKQMSYAIFCGILKYLNK